MKILIGVDDSPHARAALAFVRRMRWPPATEVVVLCSARPVSLTHGWLEPGGASYVAAAEEESLKAHEELAARVERELQEAGFTTSARVVTGDPRETIVECARAMEADLIVVGSHGRTGLTKLILGSVASHVVAHAPCNVLVVKLPGSARMSDRLGPPP